jgi:drug/metabolite transporter (DMT)-like permease
MADIAVRVRPAALSYQAGIVLVLLAGACWSMMGLGIRLMQEATVWQILFYRSMALAPFLFLVISLRSRGRPFGVIRAAGMPAVSGGMALVGAFAGGIFAIQQTTVANAMFLFATAPFFAAVLGWLLLGEPVRRATWMAMAVGAVGIAMMVHEGITLGNWLGDSMALLSGFGFAVFTLALRQNKGQDMLPAVFLSGLFAMSIAGVMCWSLGLGFLLPANDVMIALGLGVFQLGTGLTIYTFGSKVVPAAELALLSMTEVVLGPIWVWLVLGETASLQTLAGGGLLLGAIAGNALSGLRRRPGPVGTF